MFIPECTSAFDVSFCGVSLLLTHFFAFLGLHSGFTSQSNSELHHVDIRPPFLVLPVGSFADGNKDKEWLKHLLKASGLAVPEFHFDRIFTRLMGSFWKHEGRFAIVDAECGSA